MSLEWLHSFNELRAYRLDTKQGRERIETLLKQLPSMLKKNGFDRVDVKPNVDMYTRIQTYLYTARD